MPDTTPYLPKDFKAIMLSSTFTDLKEHRARAIQAIQKLGYMPRVMEFSGAQAEADVIDTSLAMVRDAVAYIGVISLKYGQTPVDPGRNPDQLSVTELEFNEAMRLGRPIVLFIMSDEHPVKKADIEADPAKLNKLDAFRERAKRMRDGSEVNRIYEVFDSLEQFSTAAAAAIGNLVRYLERSASSETKGTGRTSLHTINIPFHFVGREDDFADIDEALARRGGRSALTALHGLRGVGKTTLAAAYAERKRGNYRATWWIRAETEPTMRADLVGLGIQCGWTATDAPEEQATAQVLERLRAEGQDILLIFDNAIDAKTVANFLPHGGGAHIIVTSTAPNWGGLAARIEIDVWPKEIGADFLMARTGRAAERDAALALSEALGGLPLAHEQAAAYCERVGVSLAQYRERFDNEPSSFLGNAQDASQEYHDGLTVAKTFALAIDQAAMLHSAAKPLVTYAALLAPEPIPLFLFADGWEEFIEPFASAIARDGLDEAVAALRAFALVDRESIPDERDPSILTDCIRLHRLVREVAAAQTDESTKADIHHELIKVVSRVYPQDVYRNAATWPRARRLDAIAVALVEENDGVSEETDECTATLLGKLESYRDGALAAYAEAQKLAERALSIREKRLGRDHPDTAGSLNNLGALLLARGDLAGARSYYERALAIREKAVGLDHSDTATSLNNLGYLLRRQGDLAGARSCYERALAIFEKVLGPEHPDTARGLSNLGALLSSLGDLRGAQPYNERALAIRETALGPDHLDTAMSLNNLGYLLRAQGDLAGARPYYERTLAIFEKTLGSDHPDTARSLNNLGYLLQEMGNLVSARPYYERALAIREMVLGPDHSDTATSLNNLGGLLVSQGDFAGARPYYERALAICDKALGPDHSDTATSLNNLGYLLRRQGDLTGAGQYYERALAINEKALGPDHPDTARSLNNVGSLLRAQGDLSGARRYYERALVTFERAFGPKHGDTKTVVENIAALLDQLGQAKEASALRRKYGV
ncbi:tetratricopeptide repeat protein [Bradyrhizobium sp. 26S5]|uniref:tetratricopeptide repeat protein n=1 Tax=Bradyrhizobium sp. 26S5 TaxID=3139729 RepID=UPI0030D0E18E